MGDMERFNERLQAEDEVMAAAAGAVDEEEVQCRWVLGGFTAFRMARKISSVSSCGLDS